MDQASPLDHVFLYQPIRNEVLSELVRSKLGAILAFIPSPVTTDNDSSCLLADIGDYLTRSLAILAYLAKDLTNGPHIDEYARETIDSISEKNDFSELGVLEYMNSKLGSLQALKSKIQALSESADKDWTKSRNLSSQMSSRNMDTCIPRQCGEPERSKHSRHDTSTPNSIAGNIGSPYSNDSGDQTISNRLRELSSMPRGKDRGNTCPLGPNCSKGGISANGQLFVFERNSSYKAHLQKHEKPFRCNLLGCKNKKGFSRIDQLRRHQESVTHQ